MINASYDSKRNLVIIEFEGNVNLEQAEAFHPEIRKIVPIYGKGF